MKILFMISFIIILSLNNCLINLPIKINEKKYPLSIYMNSTAVYILVNGNIYVYNIESGEEINSTSFDILYDEYVDYKIYNYYDYSHDIQIVSKNNTYIYQINYNISSSDLIDNPNYKYNLNMNNLYENLKSISINSVNQAKILMILSNNKIYFVQYFNADGSTEILNINFEDIQYLSCNREMDFDYYIYCFCSTLNEEVYYFSLSGINSDVKSKTKID